MSNEFRLRIPYSDRDHPLDVDALDLPRALDDPEERAVAQHLLFEATVTPGMETIGDLLDKLERATPQERRRIADEAREACGFTTYSEIERNQELARIRRWPPKPPSPPPEEDQIQTCHAAGCEEVSTKPGLGPTPSRARKWFCPRHRTPEAGYQPGDLDPPKPSVRVDRRGHPLPPPHVEKFYEELYSKMQREFEQRQAQRKAERERIAKLEAEHRANLPGPPAGFRPPDYGGG